MKKNKQNNKSESQIETFKCPCFVCGNTNYRAAKCYQRKRQDSKKEGQSDVQSNLVEGNEVIAPIVVEANLVANEID